MSNKNKVQLPLFVDNTVLSTGKNHVSFSEVQMHQECGWKHYLTHILKLSVFDGNQFTEFGNAIHGGIGTYLLNKQYFSYNHYETIENSCKDLTERFDRVKFEDEQKEWEGSLRKILTETPEWFNKVFPDWKIVGVEIKLFEKIDNKLNKFFKGYIDTVLVMPKPPRKGSKKTEPTEILYWILDFKSCDYGWGAQKRRDPLKRLQLVLYKHYFCKKFNVDLKQVKCGFVLCKRNPGKNKESLELFEISVGEKTIENGLNIVDKTISLIEKKLYKKNRNSCTYCDFKNTKNCT